MTEEFVHGMGANASTGSALDTDNVHGNVTLTEAGPPFRDAMGVIVR